MEALVALASYEEGRRVREEGEEAWVEMRRLPKFLRLVARGMLAARGVMRGSGEGEAGRRRAGAGAAVAETAEEEAKRRRVRTRRAGGDGPDQGRAIGAQ